MVLCSARLHASFQVENCIFLNTTLLPKHNHCKLFVYPDSEALNMQISTAMQTAVLMVASYPLLLNYTIIEDLAASRGIPSMHAAFQPSALQQHGTMSRRMSIPSTWTR